MEAFLTEDGLSMSQAQSVTNLMNQRATDISAQLQGLNNFSRTIPYNNKDLVQTSAKPLPNNTVELLTEKANLHAAQGFLMQTIKFKDEKLKKLKLKPFFHELEAPEKPELKVAKVLPQVGEEWGWEELTAGETIEYINYEAIASHLGQFIHKGGVLDKLRKDLPNVVELDWFQIEAGKNVPVTITKHHTPEQLLAIHNKLAEMHRTNEAKVNYFKAKVKNLVTTENAKIAEKNAQAQAEVVEHNTKLLQEYNKLAEDYQGQVKELKFTFEKKRNEDIQATAKCRILVPDLFNELITIYLTKEEGGKGEK